jgi:tRNA uridine 5-carboxymethylaminomethyl modification enzyme
MENRQIPMGLDYAAFKGLSREATEKLSRIRPLTIGQACRIPGITPADVSILMVYVERARRAAAA